MTVIVFYHKLTTFFFPIDFFIWHASMNLLLSGDGHNHIVHAVVSLCEHHSITSTLFPFKLSYHFFKHLVCEPNIPIEAPSYWNSNPHKLWGSWLWFIVWLVTSEIKMMTITLCYLSFFMVCCCLSGFINSFGDTIIILRWYIFGRVCIYKLSTAFFFGITSWIERSSIFFTFDMCTFLAACPFSHFLFIYNIIEPNWIKFSVSIWGKGRGGFYIIEFWNTILYSFCYIPFSMC